MRSKRRQFRSRQWEKIAPQVWEHESGLRFCNTIIRFPDGNAVSLTIYPNADARLKTLKEVWGNHRRAMMAFCCELLERGD